MMESKLPWILVLVALTVCNLDLRNGFGAVIVAKSVGASDTAHLTSLQVDDNSVIAGPMDKQLYILMDLYPNRERIQALPAGEVKRLLLATGIKYAGAYLSRKEFKQFDKVQIDFVYVKKRDEYGRPNPLFLVQHGSVVLAHGADGSFKVIDNRIDFASH